MKRIDKKRERSSNKFVQETIRSGHNQMKPKLSFEFLTGKYCISDCQQDEKAEVIDILHRLSQRTWQEIIQLGKAGIGYEQFEKERMKCSLPTSEYFENIDKVTVFHRAPKIPIVGFRVQEIFYIFCIDRTYDAYEHN